MTTDRFCWKSSYVLWLEWRGFYADDSITTPQVVVRDRQVLDANSSAQRRGIWVGMSVSEARNIVPEVLRKAWQAEEFAPRQREWLDRCLAFSHRLEPVDQHIAAIDLAGHPRPHEIADAISEALVTAMGLPICRGAGPSKWIAALAARRHDLHTAVEDPEVFLSGLPVEWLTPIEWEHRERLIFLGYRKIGDLTRLPFQVLKGQFGETAWRIAQAARGSLADPVVASYPQDAVAATFAFDGPPDTVEGLEQGLSRLALELAEKLNARNAVGKRVEMVLEHEEGGETRLARTFARSLATARDLVNAFRLMLPQPPENPIERVRVILPDLVKARRIQLDVDDRRARADAEESMRTAVMHVRTTFGDTAVQRGSEVTIPRWKRVRRAYRDAWGWSWV